MRWPRRRYPGMRYPGGWGGLTGECGECATLEVGGSLHQAETPQRSGGACFYKAKRLQQFKKRREIRNGVKSITVSIDSL